MHLAYCRFYALLPQKTRLRNSLVYTVIFKQSVCCGLRMISCEVFNKGFRTEQTLLLVVMVFGFLNIIFSVFAVMEHCVVLYLLFKTNTGICRSDIAKQTGLIAHNHCRVLISHSLLPRSDHGKVLHQACKQAGSCSSDSGLHSKASSSNLIRNTEYLDVSLSWFLSARPNNCRVLLQPLKAHCV
jgi:hypothetical protein